MAAELFAKVFGKDGEFEIGEEDVVVAGESPHHNRLQRYRVFKRGIRTLGDLYAISEQFGDKECVVYERLTFAEVLRQAGALAHFLRTVCKVAAGDRVAIAMRNLPEWIIAFVAITHMGAVATPLNSWWGARELQYCIDNAAPTVMIVDGAKWKLLHSCKLVGVRAIVVARPDAMSLSHNDMSVMISLFSDVVSSPAHAAPLGNSHLLPDQVS